MATFDGDGRFAEAFNDRLVCLGVEINESILAIRPGLEALIEATQRDTRPTTESEADRG